MKPIMMILSSKFVMTPLIILAMVHWFIYFTSETPQPGADVKSMLFGISNGDWIERWGLTGIVAVLAALRAFVWDTGSDEADTE